MFWMFPALPLLEVLAVLRSRLFPRAGTAGGRSLGEELVLLRPLVSRRLPPGRTSGWVNAAGQVLPSAPLHPAPACLSPQRRKPQVVWEVSSLPHAKQPVSR